MRPRDKWFNLALRDCPAALENIDFWRQSNLEPMVVDVVLVQRERDWLIGILREVLLKRCLKGTYRRFPVVWRSDSDEFGCDGYSVKIIERWVVQYDSKKGGKEGSLGNKGPNSTTSHALYKKPILLLRSLYVTVRLLPAYKIFLVFAEQRFAVVRAPLFTPQRRKVEKQSESRTVQLEPCSDTNCCFIVCNPLIKMDFKLRPVSKIVEGPVSKSERGCEFRVTCSSEKLQGYGVYAEDGDEAGSLKLQRLAAQAKSFRPVGDDDDFRRGLAISY
ncbi:hypothetical protein M8C21_017671 [Ambrosia artemisiifolia]|uniref:Autophagy-related protein 13 N-terminal domain-containing protein n=1 Tax=Ambrosia artemisiifolia TaxID=4212 RepID=A0AAD5GFY5_AMBAR|nr:hypothetical protein M8C21_017671 [Ambrosia artemisiifolia]